MNNGEMGILFAVCCFWGVVVTILLYIIAKDYLTRDHDYDSTDLLPLVSTS